jgi:hypothetical protein
MLYQKKLGKIKKYLLEEKVARRVFKRLFLTFLWKYERNLSNDFDVFKV